jgi:hypothetical protein
VLVVHRAVYLNATKEIILYGGKSYLQENPASVSATWENLAKGKIIIICKITIY